MSFARWLARVLRWSNLSQYEQWLMVEFGAPLEADKAAKRCKLN